ncbi:hypothetical protein B0W47_16790 (plasmid) [Komagataeibacter nataicola]|uniref:Uncharacterized protein n=2 Tax=Komagataeibacter nataicola TaxID=265960 RepID=A0A9N7H2W4_9PROT|nr:DUF6516 family protein [Komagataeibacter nataicola]AQU89237.1 hypothetical protein B0W47_16790 [Komagataeibacter nataicola]PYD66305.1 hypothetical protein CDI09_09155 [Komagataeibacter nataicola]WNM10358.1 DUF6516 family protein [Komagataeibacter nataicola]
MKAVLMVRERNVVSPTAFVEIVIWKVPVPVPASEHDFKYRLAFVMNGECIIRYDNEAGKGDHKHIDGGEVSYTFISMEQLIVDFMDDVESRMEA